MTDQRRPDIVHVTTVHSPFDVRIFHKQCVSLAAAGYDVALIQTGTAAETVKGVRIVPLRASGSRIARMTRGVWRAVRAVRRLRPKVVHFHDVEFIWGALLLKMMGHRIIYDVHEDVAKDLEDKHYLPAFAVAPIRLVVQFTEWLAVVFFDRVVAATSSIRDRFPGYRARLIRNTPILGEMSVADRVPFAERPRTVGYLGGLAQFNGPLSMVEAMSTLPPTVEAKLMMGGKFPDPVLEKAVRGHPGWVRVEFLGWVDRASIAAVMQQLRAGLVLYQPSPNVVASEPNKFFEFLSAGVPLIASNFPAWREFVDRIGCGISVDPSDSAAVADAIAYMLDNPDEAEAMGRRGLEAVTSHYNWGRDGASLVNLYGELIGPAEPTHA